MMCKNICRWHIVDIFLIFSRQIGFEISYKFSPVEIISMNVKAFFLGKIRKKYQYVVYWISKTVIKVTKSFFLSYIYLTVLGGDLKESSYWLTKIYSRLCRWPWLDCAADPDWLVCMLVTVLFSWSSLDCVDSPDWTVQVNLTMPFRWQWLDCAADYNWALQVTTITEQMIQTGHCRLS